jgi:AcrR family transcriptional regulator
MDQLCNRRETKRHQTALRLQQCAVQLTVDNGFDGWTIDDLATAADVSRRTVFNYFDGKAEVVLGPEPEVDEQLMAEFVAGGPTGRLFDDLIVLAHEATREKAESEQQMAAVRDAVMNDPRLLKLVHERFEIAAAMLGDCIRQREGDDFPVDTSRTILRLLITCFDDALERTGSDSGRTFHEHFDACVTDIRSALA